MNRLQRKNGIFSVLILAALAIGFSLVGYGEGHTAMHIEALRHSENTPAPTRTSVIYERQYLGHTDLLHLEVDTTYHTRGKKGYRYETVCNNKVSLRSFDQGYVRLNAETESCFVEGGRYKWLKVSDEKTILGYLCHHALVVDGDTSWEAWYCDALPHRPDIASLKSRQSGLILAACNSDKTYTLKAKNITHTII